MTSYTVPGVGATGMMFGFFHVIVGSGFIRGTLAPKNFEAYGATISPAY